MAYIPQIQLENLKKLVQPNKVVVILGPRRAGKTTLIKKFVDTLKFDPLFVNGDDTEVGKALGSRSINKIRNFVGDNQMLLVDEAQRVTNIGLGLKIAIDNIPGIKIIATGSSSFDLNRKVGEPLTGRKFTLYQYPTAQLELKQIEHGADTKSSLEDRLIYGSYPEIVTLRDNMARELLLKEMISSYVLRDVFVLEGVRKAEQIVRLLELLAYQIGHEVSLSELGTQVGLDKKTVDHYLYLLQEAFVIRYVGGFSRNLRKEVSKSGRVYFVDNGIRNAFISNFNSLSLRNDVGMLWENYLFMERIKRQEYLGPRSNNYFWRTYDKKEIDMVEEREGKLFGYEFKWSPKKLPKAPKDWLGTYSNASYEVITQDNYLDFIT